LRIQDKQINIPTKIGDAFNQYFITTAGKTQVDNSKRKEAVKLLHESKNNDTLEMKLIPTTEAEIKHVTESMKLKNSAGYEGMSCRILKYCIHAIAKPLSHIRHASLNQGIYTGKLIFAIVMAIYKQGEKNDVANYTPISLITIFANILKKVMYSRISQHLNVKKILTLEKFGLKKIIKQQFIHLQIIS
jgi:hypothetical protein